jgi:4-amino-4-deoxy-L-arabinose transferase-like glycosyltransferase
MTVTTKDSGSEPSRPTWRARRLRAVVDFAVESHARAVAVLVVVSLLAFLPGFFQIPPMDRDEARFAQATKQMVETGDVVDIRYQDEVRYKKPVGIYWMQAAAVKAGAALGVRDALHTISLYRVPSLLGAVIAVLLTYWTALAFVSRRAAVLAGLMLATSIMLGAEARIAKTDAMLLATIVAAYGALGRLYLGTERAGPGFWDHWRLPAIFWTAMAIGILIKGPLIVMFIGLTIVALVIADRSGHWLWGLRPLPGMIWTCLLILPWFVAILGKAGEQFLASSVGEDMISKIFSGQESHGAPPGYYFLLFWVTFWPGAALAAMAAQTVWASRRERGARFLLAWIIPSWVVFELVMTKLPHYVLPTYPAIAILIAGVVNRHVLARERWLTRGASWWFVLAAILALGSIVALIAVVRQPGLLAWPFAAVALILGFLAWRLYEADGAELSLLRGIAASIFVAFAVYGVVLPSMSPLFVSASLSQAVKASNCPSPQSAAVGFHEPSMVFLVGTSTRLTDAQGAADFLRAGGCRFAFVETRYERNFLRRAEAIGLRYSQGPRIDGINYAAGRTATIAVFRSEPNP